ncbi:MAG: hypothetical protein FWH10_01070 [Oscillospiraceae bacterium]|nr:hypothetical protein [Oscillospiraceae bacterium]
MRNKIIVIIFIISAVLFAATAYAGYIPEETEITEVSESTEQENSAEESDNSLAFFGLAMVILGVTVMVMVTKIMRRHVQKL